MRLASARSALAALALLCTMVCATAYAHPGIGYNLRAVHVVHDGEGATLYMRLTLPLVVANQLGAARPDGTFVPAPYTYNRVESGVVFHYLDFAQLRAHGAQLAKFVVQGHELRVRGSVVPAEILGVRVHVKGDVPPFSTLEDAHAALQGALLPSNETEIDTGFVLVDTALRYSHAGGIDAFSLRSTLVPGELGEPLTRNIVWDHRNGQSDVYQSRGLLESEWMIDPAATSAAVE